MTSFVLQLGAFAIIAAGVLVVVGASRLGWRVFAVGLILIVGATALAPSGTATGSDWATSLTGATGWIAAAGLCLVILGARWGGWLMLPAGLCFVAWPVMQPMISQAPLWFWLVLLPILPVFALILAIRAGQGVLTGLFGNDAAAHVAAHWIIQLLGSPGRKRRRPLRDPALPRARVAPFHFYDVGGPP